jgi:hypothetical protein
LNTYVSGWSSAPVSEEVRGDGGQQLARHMLRIRNEPAARAGTTRRLGEKDFDQH